MIKKIIVVSNPKDLSLPVANVEVVLAKDYLTKPEYGVRRDVRVYNLCRSYTYQQSGYYVSLLAEARRHRVVPSIMTLQDFKSQSLVRVISAEIDHLIQRKLSHIKSTDFTLSIYFGRNLASRYDDLSRKFFNLFEAPLLQAQFSKRNRKWQLQSIRPIPLGEIPETHIPFFQEQAHKYFSRHRAARPNRRLDKGNLAILVNEKEEHPPSDKKALSRFVRAAQKLGMSAEFIGRDQYAEIGEYDGLFIRATTKVSDYTYRFARKAMAEGLVVIDDPLSIARCTNKVYLSELVQREKLPSPRTRTVTMRSYLETSKEIGFPLVIKQPDSAFSCGVTKCHDEANLTQVAQQMFKQSDFLIIQEYMPTDFDWRVGVLAGTPLYVCKYFMAKGHWQIYNWEEKERQSQTGDSITMKVEDAPPAVVNLAVKASSFIGDGFYGVDIKTVENKHYLIEVNDNPSVDSGVEDAVLKDELYLRIMEHFRDKIKVGRG